MMTQCVAVSQRDAADRSRTLPLNFATPRASNEPRVLSRGSRIPTPRQGAPLDAFDNVAAKIQKLNQELERLYGRERSYLQTIRRLREQLDLAASIQQNLLPASLPDVRGMDVHLLYQPADAVSGDTYEAVRLDDHRVAFAIADATGHGMSAALLSAYVKQALRGTDSAQPTGRAIRPERILQTMNRQLLAADLPDCQCIAALYAVYDERRRTMQWARGGAPFPILIENGQPPRPIVSAGPLVGALDDPIFEIVKLNLKPGDALVFYTDGLDQLATAALTAQQPAGPPMNAYEWSEAALSGPVIEWLATKPLTDLKRRLADAKHHADALRHAAQPLDDTTVLALTAHSV